MACFEGYLYCEHTFALANAAQALVVQVAPACKQQGILSFSLMMSVFSSPLYVLAKLCFSVAAFTISFLLPLRLLSVFIKMKGSFDVRF